MNLVLLFQRSGAKVFVWVIFVWLCLLITWISLARVDQVVRAEGQVIPATKKQVIQHLEGGIVSTIMVSEGSPVKRGDLLVSIQDRRADSQLQERLVRMAGLKARIGRLRAEAEGASDVNAMKGLSVNDPGYAEERRLFVDRQNKLQQEVQVLSEQIRQRQAEIRSLEDRKKSLSAEFDVANKQFLMISGLLSRNAASQMEFLDAQSRVRRFQTQMTDAESSIPKLQAEIQELKARVNGNYAKFRAESRDELGKTELELAQVKEQSSAETDRVARTEIRAPMDGIVNRLFINTIGGVVKPGDPIAEITPLEEKVVMEGKVRPADRADLRPGLGLQARVSAYDYAMYGTLPGKLTEVSADTVVDERGNLNYRVRMELDVRHTALSNKPLTPGMTVTADIVTGRRTILQYLLSPLHRFTDRAFRDAK